LPSNEKEVGLDKANWIFFSSTGYSFKYLKLLNGRL